MDSFLLKNHPGWGEKLPKLCLEPRSLLPQGFFAFLGFLLLLLAVKADASLPSALGLIKLAQLPSVLLRLCDYSG